MKGIHFDLHSLSPFVQTRINIHFHLDIFINIHFLQYALSWEVNDDLYMLVMLVMFTCMVYRNWIITTTKTKNKLIVWLSNSSPLTNFRNMESIHVEGSFEIVMNKREIALEERIEEEKYESSKTLPSS